MTLLENEVKLDSLTKFDRLTNYRIVQEEGDSYKISIFLEDISSILMHRKSNIVLLILGIIALLAGVYMVGFAEGLGTALLVVGALFIIAFFVTRKHIIKITPNGGEDIEITTKGLSHERVEVG